jgi:feruloyl esterase
MSMNSIWKLALASLLVAAGVPSLPAVHVGAQSAPQAATAALPDIGERKTITEADCTATKLGTTIPIAAIGEPVSTVGLSEPKRMAAADPAPAYCTVDGSMAPIDPAAKPINFRVVFPASWTLRAAQFGGGGINGIIPSGKLTRASAST